MYELVRGPLALAAALICLGGLILQAIRFFRLTKRVEPARQRYKPLPRETGLRQAKAAFRRKALLERTVLGMEPGMVLVTAAFHAGLILVPLTLEAHVQLLEASWGLAPPALPEAASDALTLLVLGLGAALLFRRLAVDKVRSITGPVDILLLAVVLAPFATGFLAYHQWTPYRPMVIAHILSSELMLVCIPFTRLAHALFFFLARTAVSGEYSFGRGGRVWRR